MKLKLIKSVLGQQGAGSSGATDDSLEITGITYDSRQVKPGFAFFCIPGEHVDGNQFIADAIKCGAACVVTEKTPAQSAVPAIVVPDVRGAMAAVSAEFYGHPSRQLRVIGITGTNGKTTTTHLLERILTDCGMKTGLIGTLGTRTDAQGEYKDAKHTTPQAADLQRMLADMHKSGCRYVSMEVSSHALAQKRVADCEFAVAVLTNITQDHLDFHKTMEHYWRSKRLLFEALNDSKQLNLSAVINYDDPLYKEFASVLGPKIRRLSYGWQAPADVHVSSCAYQSGGTKLKLATPEGPLEMNLRLAGQFNVYNVMAAVAVCLAEGIDKQAIKQSLEAFPGVAGRFEVVSTTNGNEPLCIVDYAHTPDGLDNVLKAAAHLVPPGGKLLVVFGCGGDRDPSKRPQMGKIAESAAHEVIVTSDNPRSEEPEHIIQNILVGIQRMTHVKVEPDRAKAIRMAVSSASEQDVVVVAGKGHENYQILADKIIPFDDRQEVLAALQERACT
ncbi:MAG TPA: UDP-N-acetylmuramoyl-L-alanyl-D-glutamate--2,6-diaminopimelate ligase [Candidatus Obscuribacterales bacterium]